MQRLQSKQEESTEAEEMKQQQRMAIMEDLIRKIRSKEELMLRADGGLLKSRAQIVIKHGLTKDGRMLCRNGTNGWNT